jgi:flagellar biosynthesis protein FlhF
MDVRKFEAFTIADAIKLVKKELGREAVILSTKDKETVSLETGKTLKTVEVLAAASASSDASRSQQNRSGVHSDSSQVRTVQFPRLERQSQTTVVKGSPFLNVQQKLDNTLRTKATEADPFLRQTAAFGQNQSTAQAARSTSNQIQAGEINGLRDELEKMRKDLENIPQVHYGEQMEEIKILLHDLMRTKTVASADGNNPYLNDVCLKLRAAGVKESIISEMTQFVLVSDANSEQSEMFSRMDPVRIKEKILSHSIRYLFKQFQITNDWKIDANRQTVICLVGPTGVGKTTTAAKLAAKYKLIEKKKIALVSMDTYRVGGVEQLKTYSKILDCPFAEASDPKDLENFFVRQSDAQVVIIDSAGFSPRAGSESTQLKLLQSLPVPALFHLVMSSNTKQRDLEETFKNYAVLSLKSLIFTKLDESWGFGEILNTAIFSKVPISYFTTGQKVPEDLEVATKERVIERLFKL